MIFFILIMTKSQITLKHYIYLLQQLPTVPGSKTENSNTSKEIPIQTENTNGSRQSRQKSGLHLKEDFRNLQNQIFVMLP